MKVMFTGATAVAAGSYHPLVIKQDCSVWATGWNQYGRLGDGSTNNREIFFQVMRDGAKVRRPL